MNRYLISAAVLALLAGSAFAQPDDHRGGGRPGGEGGHERGGAAPAGAAAPAAAPAPRAAAPAQNRATFGRESAQRHNDAARAAAPAAAPAAQPQATRDNRGGNMGFAGVNRALVGDPRNDNNHPGNRPDVGRPDNRPGFGGPGNNRPGAGRPGNAPQPNFSGFRDYHRNFSAPHRFRAPSYHRPSGFSYRRWNFGDFLPSLFWAQQYWLNDYNDYDMPPPPPGTTWVRYNNDALLIDRYTGEIVTVEYDVFY